MSLKRKHLIIYDLDGTIIDTRDDIAHAANAMRVAMGKPPLKDSEIYVFVGKGLRYLVEQCLETKDEAQLEKGLGGLNFEF